MQEETIKASKVRNHWNSIINDVYAHGKLVILERNNLVVGGIVSPEEIKIVQEHRAKIAERKKLLEDMWKQFEDVPEDEVARHIEKARLELWEEKNKTDAQHVPH